MKLKRWTDTERRLLQQALNDGLSNQEIGEILGRTAKGVQVYRSKNQINPTVKQHVKKQRTRAANDNASLLEFLVMLNLLVSSIALITLHIKL